jgi:hypothetical protein
MMTGVKTNIMIKRYNLPFSDIVKRVILIVDCVWRKGAYTNMAVSEDIVCECVGLKNLMVVSEIRK